MRKLGAIVATAIVAVTTVGGIGATAAVAADYDYPGAIDPASIVVTTTDGSPDTTVDERLRIDAAWSVPDGAVGGQTFGFTLPTQFAGFTGSFAVPAQDDPTQTVAKCTVSTGRPPVVTCTLTDYVDGRSDISGSLWFQVTAAEETTSTTVDFTVDGTVTPVAIPGGAIVGEELPTVPEKWSWQTADGRLAWQLLIPGAGFADADPLIIDDTLTPAGAGFAEHHNVDDALSVWSTNSAGTDRRPVTAWTGGWNDSGTAFHLEIAGPIDPARLYSVRYYTVPSAPANGDSFGNVANIGGVVVRDTEVWTGAGGGAGTGQTPGMFSIQKVLAGDATAVIPDGTTFEVAYSYGNPVVRKELEVTVGGPTSSISLPRGTVVTLEEIDLPTLAGVTWGTPSFSGTGVRSLEQGKAEVTIVTGATVAITLTNTAARVEVPPTTPPTTTPPPTTVKTPPATPPSELPLTSGLASTGSDVPSGLLWAGGVIMLLGLALTGGAALRRRGAHRDE
ncbi:MAG: Ig-like domain-containing protein [Candidatus Microbacterium colombiense]|nr:MAG: Ig-like domain-containing protein [Microbacterium sp.]